MENNRENALEKINSFYDDDHECMRKKAEYFDKIAQFYYFGNFGATNKSEIELLMFSIFMDEMVNYYQDKGGVLDYKECSDFRIAKMLGIPQDKVKNLKIKKQARYPIEFDWKKSFVKIKDSIVYDSNKERIVIPMNDPNLYMAIKNFIEEHDGYIEIQRGANVLQMRPEYFFSLLYLGVEKEEEKEKIKKTFIKELKQKNEINNVDLILTDKEMVDLVISTGDEVLGFFEELAQCVNNPLLAILKGIRKIGKIIQRVK